MIDTMPGIQVDLPKLKVAPAPPISVPIPAPIPERTFVKSMPGVESVTVDGHRQVIFLGEATPAFLDELGIRWDENTMKYFLAYSPVLFAKDENQLYELMTDKSGRYVKFDQGYLYKKRV